MKTSMTKIGLSWCMIKGWIKGLSRKEIIMSCWKIRNFRKMMIRLMMMGRLGMIEVFNRLMETNTKIFFV
jgi:hypothetical protein